MEVLKTLYKEWSGSECTGATLLPLSGSARKYYRLCGPAGSAIGCIGTNPAENKAFLTIATNFRAHGIAAPELYAVSADSMSYLQEDLGDGQLFEILKPNIEKSDYSPEQLDLLHKTMRALPELQFKGGEGLDWDVCFPDREFNARMVNFDLNYFKYDFLKFTGLEFNEIRLQDDFDRLCADTLSFEGQTFMYRDFQARNVMIKDGRVRFIDFQGGRRGPVAYDLASFLWNAGTHFPAALRAELEESYIAALGQYCEVDRDAFYAKYRGLTLLRLLQETGAYGFRGIIERKQLFLDCIPTVLGCFRELTATPFEAYPYLNETLLRLANEWDGSTILPGLKIEV